MARENVMSTPIFDQLLLEMAQRAEPRATSTASPAPASTTPAVAPAAAVAPASAPASPASGEELTPAPRRRHRAD